MWFSVLFAKAVGDEDSHHYFSYPTVYFNQAQIDTQHSHVRAVSLWR
jgi:hypothetical protein